MNYIKIQFSTVVINGKIRQKLYFKQNFIINSALHFKLVFFSQLSHVNTELYEDCLTSGCSLKWPFEELQFLTLKGWLNFLAQDVAA